MFCVCVRPRRWWNVVTFESSKRQSAESFVSAPDALPSGFSRSTHDNVNECHETKPKKRRLHCALFPIFIVIRSTSDVRKDLDQATLFAAFLSACALNELCETYFGMKVFFRVYWFTRQNWFPRIHFMTTSLNFNMRAVRVVGEQKKKCALDEIRISSYFAYGWKRRTAIIKIDWFFGVWCASGWIMSLCDFRRGWQPKSELLMFFQRIFVYE